MLYVSLCAYMHMQCCMSVYVRTCTGYVVCQCMCIHAYAMLHVSVYTMPAVHAVCAMPLSLLILLAADDTRAKKKLSMKSGALRRTRPCIRTRFSGRLLTAAATPSGVCVCVLCVCV